MEKKLIKMWVGIKAKALVKMWVGNVVNALLHFLCFVNNTLSLCQRVQIYLGRSVRLSLHMRPTVLAKIWRLVGCSKLIKSPGWQGGSGKVKIWPKMGLTYIHFWLWSLLEAPKWFKDSGNGPQMIPPTTPDWLESISGVLDPFKGL